MNDFLVSYLDAIDERLLEYLDENDELNLDTVQRLYFYTSALLASSITPDHPDHIAEDWPDWFQLAPAFVAACGKGQSALERASLRSASGASKDSSREQVVTIFGQFRMNS